MKQLIWGLLFSVSFWATSWVFAQNSDSSGVLISPPIQDQGLNTGNNGGTNTSNSKHQQTTNSTTSTNSSDANASSQNNQNSTSLQGKQKVPAQYAISACQDSSEADACQMTTSHGTRPGICTYTSDKKYLYCKHQRNKKPREQRQQ